jgi:general secretion pathway protein F
MISSGEASGGLEAVLNNLADYLEAQLAMQRKIISALVYPALLLTFCTLIVLYLFTNVVPTIVEVFVKQGRPLPLPTQITMAISNAIINYWYLIIFSIGGTILFISWYLNTKNGKAVFDTFMIKAPAIGITYKKIATARVAKTLSALLGSGVGLLEALDIARNIMSNSHLRKALEEAQEGVREGKSLARELSRSGLFPIMLSQMVAVGERSGSLEPMLERASRTYETEVNISLDGLTALIQPVMIIGLGGIVLGIVMSVMMPMMDLMQIVQG